MDRESAFFALFLDCELAHSLMKRGILKGDCFHCCVCVDLSTKHKQWSSPIIHYFSFHGSASPTVENKDKFGRLRSVVFRNVVRLSRWTDEKQTIMQLNQKSMKSYEAPQVEVIEIEPQGLLCASGGVATNAGGGTESMTMVEIDWP